MTDFYSQWKMTNPDDFPLPPMFDSDTSGKITWKHLGEIDFELMGYLLSCHLTVEHYMDEFLKAKHPELDWENAKMSFAQRMALISKWTATVPSVINPLPVIKHLNTLRNRYGHRLNYTLTQEDMLPFVYYLQGITNELGDLPLKNESPKRILHLATWCCCTPLVHAIQPLDDNNEE